MRLNKLLIGLIILIFVSSIGMAAAEDASVAGYKFTVPEGYKVIDTTDDSVVMQMDDNNAIVFSTNVGDDLDAAKQTFIDQGKKLIEENVQDLDGMEVTLQAFSVPGTDINSYNYIVLSDDGNVLVTISSDDPNFDTDLKSEGNPAAAIFNSLEME